MEFLRSGTLVGLELGKNEAMTNENNPMRDRTPRVSGTWWVLIIVLLVVAGIFVTLGRSGEHAPETGPLGSPSGTQLAPPDQIENTVEASGQPLLDTDTLPAVPPRITQPTTSDL